MDSLRDRTVSGTFFHAPALGRVECLEDALVSVDADGRIAAVHRRGDPGTDAARSAAASAGRLVTIPAGRFVLPGFVDLHIHAPQYPQLGKALHVPLEVWLQRYTFPLEARYADVAFARRVLRGAGRRPAGHGTTTALYFATIHQEATRLLADICLEKGQRALIGKVAMDNPAECPDYYRDASAEAGDRGHACADRLRARASRQFRPARPARRDAALHPLLHRRRCWRGSARWPRSAAATSRRIVRRATGSMATSSPATA